MAIRTGEYHRPPAEVWDAKKCARMAKRVAKDGLGTPYPWPGYIGSSATPGGYGKTRYNGGCERDGDWWEGEINDLPQVAEGFTLILVPTWGWRIVRVTDTAEWYVGNLEPGQVFDHQGVTFQVTRKSNDPDTPNCVCVAANGEFGKNFTPGVAYYLGIGIPVMLLDTAE